MTSTPLQRSLNRLTTFNAPPLDHHLSIPKLYEYHAVHSPDHAVFTYADAATGVPRDVTFAEAWKTISFVAAIVSQHSLKQPDGEAGERYEGRPVISILALSDSLSYIYLMLAIMSLGYVAYPLSPLNSAEAVAHLLKARGVTQVFVSDDQQTRNIAHVAIDIMRKEGNEVDMLPMIRPDDYASLPHTVNLMKTVDIDDDDIVLILHSSGCTGLPKPIPITNRGLRSMSNTPRLGEFDVVGCRIAGHTNPPSHGLGVMAITVSFAYCPAIPGCFCTHKCARTRMHLECTVSCGATFALYPPVFPPTVPNPANFIAAWKACKCDVVICIPAFIEALSQNPDNLPALKALDCLIYSGACMNKTVGDRLSASGINLRSLWGSTEGGVPIKCDFKSRNSKPDDWEYFEFSPHADIRMQPQEDINNTFEPVLVASDMFFPHVPNTTVDDKPALAFGDLMEHHSDDPKRWRVLGRKDDQIVLSCGPIVNPVPIEESLVQDSNIASAIIFGQHRLELGILIEPASGSIPPGDAERLERFKDTVWPALEKTNARCAPFARIRRNMILVTYPEKPLQYTAKRTARRGVCLKLYAEDIEKLYKREADPSPESRPYMMRM
ncbi:acetyl-CoA synthetase-like protein [Trametes punicea]|nr:acetyl-CoA synthetase-like protein [Trametes punicea]